MTNESFNQELLAILPQLRRYARTLAGNASDADDIVQDCLLRVMRSQTSFIPGVNIKAWIFTILNNVFIDSKRKQRAITGVEDLDDAPQDWKEATGERALKIRDLQNAIMLLPSEQRQVLLMVTVEGFSYQEVGSILDIAQGTVMSRLHRAREFLRSQMSDKDEAVA